MQNLISKHKILWSNKLFACSAIIAILFFIGSLFANYAAVKYAIREVGNGTTDILLDNLPLVNTDIIFSEGALVFVLLIVFLLIKEPKIIPFVLKSIALFICIRSLFVIMTHLGPFPYRIVTDFDNLRYVSTSGADLFFSGHTGLPFLMAFLFWKNRNLRLFFLFSSFAAAAAVLLGHLHYTIDVFSAFFISYGIYRIALRIFPKDYQFFTQDSQIKKLI
jgi:hypothetical protein